MITRLLSDFPIRLLPQPAESLFGFIGRVYAANGHRIPRTEPGATLYAVWFADRVDAVAQLGGSSGGENRSSTVDLTRFQFARHAHKYCCKCMRETGYQLRTIDVAQSAVCPLHLIRLQSKCSLCHGRITLNAISSEVCACGAHLGIETTPASLGLEPVCALWEAKVLEALTFSPLPANLTLALDRCMPAWLRELTFSEVDCMLQEIRKLKRFPKELRQDRPENGALIQWPEAFHDTLRSAIQRKMRCRAPIVGQRYLFKLLPEIRRLAVDEDIPSEVRRRVSDFLDAHALSEIASLENHGRWLANPSIAASEYMSKRFVHADDVAAAIGWQNATVRSLIRRLGLPAIELPDKGILLEQHVASELMQKLSGLVPLQEVALSFGVDDQSFIQLLQRCGLTRHLVAAQPRHGPCAYRPEFVFSAAVSAFRRILFSRCLSDAASAAREWVLISQLLDMSKSNANRFDRQKKRPPWYMKALTASALAAILDGRLNAFCAGEPQDWCDIRIDPVSARAVLKLSFNTRSLHEPPSPVA